ncbi:MAG: hypothetical protein H6Q65_783 [Firmicutes bacterium]|nr:hypothetical protein [Bacillota bacterium]
MQKSDFTMKIGGISLETFPFFVQIAADTQDAYKDIDLLYATDEKRFGLVVAASSYIEHPFILSKTNIALVIRQMAEAMTSCVEEHAM